MQMRYVDATSLRSYLLHQGKSPKEDYKIHIAALGHQTLKGKGLAYIGPYRVQNAGSN